MVTSRLRRRSESDPFELRVQPPKGKAYQWCALSVLGDKEIASDHLNSYEDAGWKPVPAKRHPKMPHRGNRIIVGNQVLMERSADAVDKALRANEAHARSMSAEASCAHGHGTFQHITPIGGAYANYVVEVAALKTEIKEKGHPRVEIGIDLTDREIEASIIVGLPLAEYARRKVMMIGQLAAPGAVTILREVSQGVFKFDTMGVFHERS